MDKKLMFFIMSAVFLLNATSIYAQTSVSNPITISQKDIDEFRKNQSQFLQNSIGAQDRHQKAKATRQLELDKKFQELVALSQKRQEELRADGAVRQSNFKDKIRTFKDKTKRNRIGQIAVSLNRVNSRAVSDTQHALNDLTQIATRIDNYTDQIATVGGDTSQIESILSRVSVDIVNTKFALDDQKVKDYTPRISDAGKVRSDAATSFNSLKGDLITHRNATTTIQSQIRAAIAQIKIVENSIIQESQNNIVSTQSAH